MCLLVLAPKTEISLEYVAETLTLKNGGSTDVLDILIRNDSEVEMERLHVLYPYPLDMCRQEPFKTKTVQSIDLRKPGLHILTNTILNKKHELNRFYRLDIDESVPENPIVTLHILNPQDEDNECHYEGVAKLDQSITPFIDDSGNEIPKDEWDMLQSENVSIHTVTFHDPVQPGEKRWLRLLGVTGTIEENVAKPVVRTIKKLSGQLLDRFTIIGPKNVRTVVSKAIRNCGNPDQGRYQSLQSRTRHLNLDAQSLTEYSDWRINVLYENYSALELPSSAGNIMPVPERKIRSKYGEVENVFQWMSCPSDWPEDKTARSFQIDLTAVDRPFWVPLLFAIGALAGIISLLITLYLFFTR